MTQVPNLQMNDGRDIPQLGYGVFQVDPAQTEQAVTTALEAGYRSIDTAQAYKNESGVGAALAKSDIARDDLFITTKLWNANHNTDAALKSFDQSLKALQLDYVDLFLIHWPTPMFDNYVEAWKALETLHSDGRAKSIGVSNFTEEHLQRLFDETGTVPALNQVELHPGFAQEQLRKFHEQHNILTEAWSPIGQGGDLLKDADLNDLAQQLGKSSAQVVLRWHIQLGNVVIPKSVTPSRIKENLEVFDFELNADQMSLIDNISGGRMGPDPDRFDVH